MKFFLLEKVREFLVNGVAIKDQGEVFLDSNELISFVTKTGKKYDFIAKDWGFYASPSLNDRLVKEGFKSALVKNDHGQIYLMAVDIDKIDIFYNYIKSDHKIIMWLDAPNNE
jgi:hypothetical protein